MNDVIYLHAINEFRPINLDKLKKIFNSGYILSRNMQKNRPMIDKWTYGFNGNDYISLCRYNGIKKEAYKNFVENNISLLIDERKVQIEEVSYIDEEMAYLRNSNGIYKYGESAKTRFSNMSDEVQVKDRISLDSVYGIALPLENLCNEEKKERVIELYNKIEELIAFYDYDINLYDLNNFELIENVNDVKKKLNKKV